MTQNMILPDPLEPQAWKRSISPFRIRRSAKPFFRQSWPDTSRVSDNRSLQPRHLHKIDH